ncbi:MAG: hypothetical protein AAB425_08895 [Bdellovibrionota bacterium]
MKFHPVRLLKEASLALIFATGVFVLVAWPNAWASDTVSVSQSGEVTETAK